VAISEDATAGYWNPAGLNEIQSPVVAAMHETRFNGTVNYNYGALAIPLDPRSTAAISVMHLGISDIPDTRSALVDLNHNGQLDADDYLDYNKVSRFGNYDWVAVLSYAKKIATAGGVMSPQQNIQGYDLSWGVNAKLIYRRLDPQTTGTGIGFDVAMRYKPSGAITLAGVVQDITTTLLSYSTGTKELVSPTLKLGGSYLWTLDSAGNHRILPTADIDLRFESRTGQVAAGPISADFHEGIEYSFKNLFALRAGYNDMQMWSAGAGVSIGKLHVDYAYLAANGLDQLGSTHRVSLVFLLDQPKWRRNGQ